VGATAVWSDKKLQTFANSIGCEVLCVPCSPLSDPRVAAGGATAIWGGKHVADICKLARL